MKKHRFLASKATVTGIAPQPGSAKGTFSWGRQHNNHAPRRPYVIAIALAALICGCASEPTGAPASKVWYRPGNSAEESRRDLAACRYHAIIHAQSFSERFADDMASQNDPRARAATLAIIDGMAENARQNKIVRNAMIAKGYSLVDKNSPQLPNSTIPIGYANSSQSLRAKAQSGIVPIAKATPEQLKIATDKIRAKAEAGDTEAQFQLGSFYYTGDFGVTKDFTEAIKWYQKAADQNHANMQFPLASAYAQRGVVEQDKGDLDTLFAAM